MHFFKLEVKPVESFITFYINFPSKWIKNRGIKSISGFMKEQVFVLTVHFTRELTCQVLKSVFRVIAQDFQRQSEQQLKIKCFLCILLFVKIAEV